MNALPRNVEERDSRVFGYTQKKVLCFLSLCVPLAHPSHIETSHVFTYWRINPDLDVALAWLIEDSFLSFIRMAKRVQSDSVVHSERMGEKPPK